MHGRVLAVRNAAARREWSRTRVTAARILTALEQPADPLLMLLENAPIDDEPFDPAGLDGTG